MMTQTLKHTNHLQMNIRLMFDACFKYETLIRLDFGQRMTHRDRCIIQARESVLTTPLMSVLNSDHDRAETYKEVYSQM